MRNKLLNEPVTGMNCFRPALPFLVFAVICLLLPGLAIAAGGWKWKFDLASPVEKQPFLMPVAVYLEPAADRFYVVEAGSNSLHSFKINGEYLNTFSPGGDSLLQPFDMVRDSESGHLWVVEKGRNSLTKINMKEKKLTPNVLTYRGVTIYPDRLALLKNKLYVLDKSTGAIITYGFDLKAGEVFESAGNGFVDFVVKDSQVWGLDASQKKVTKFALTGESRGEISLGDEVAFPIAIEVGPSGFIYVLDRHEGSVAVFDNSGNFKYRFLEKGHNKTSLYYPEDLLFDSVGRLCVVDTGNGRVGVFSR